MCRDPKLRRRMFAVGKIVARAVGGSDTLLTLIEAAEELAEVADLIVGDDDVAKARYVRQHLRARVEGGVPDRHINLIHEAGYVLYRDGKKDSGRGGGRASQ